MDFISELHDHCSGPVRGHPTTASGYVQLEGVSTSDCNQFEEFLNRHWDQIVASDFFTVEVWTCTGLTRFVVLFFIDLSTRKVEIGGIASSVNGLWMNQIARNLTDVVDGFFAGKRYLIHDRDPLYTKQFLCLGEWQERSGIKKLR